MGAAAKIIKIDCDILSIRTKLLDKDSPELKAKLNELLKKREAALVELEKQARERIK